MQIKMVTFVAFGFMSFALSLAQKSSFIISECFNGTEVEFMFSNDPLLAFVDARDVCALQNGFLVSLTTVTKYDQLVQFFENNVIEPNKTFVPYIGLIKTDNTSTLDPTTFVWEDGTVIAEGDFGSIRGEFPWLNGRPNDSNENEPQDCIVISSNDFELNDFICRTQRPYFCERPCNFIGEANANKNLFGDILL